MKRTASAVVIIVLLTSAVTVTKLFALAEVNTQEAQLGIISLEEAVQALNMKDLSYWHAGYSYTGEPNQTVFADGTEVSAFLMWIAPNGTFYEAEYPKGNLLGEIGYMLSEHSWNPPEGIFIWHLANHTGLEGFWMLANNGTIVHAYTLRDKPVLPVSPALFHGLIVATIVFVVGVGFILYFRKRKHQ